MSEARSVRDFGTKRILLTGTLGAYEVWQMPTGEAGFYDNAVGKAAGQYATFKTRDDCVLSKATGFVALKGGRAYWDHSANNVTYKRVNDKDFYVGRFAEDAISAADECVVDLNADPPYDIDIARDAFLSVPVGTQAVGAFGYPKRVGGAHILELTATSEAQKIDMLSVDGFDLDANAIVEAIFCITNDGSNATQDFTIGVASGTHASNFQTIASFVAVSTVGASTAINAQSDDNSTDVDPEDTTLTYSEGSAVANRVTVWFDFRDPADVQIYVDGVLVNAATVFTAGTSGTHFLIAHLEKTTGTDVYAVRVDALRCWTAEQ